MHVGKFMPDSKSLENELSAVNTAATALCEGLSADQLAWRPHPAKWSIAENLLHLSTTTEVFLPAVDHAILESRRRWAQSGLDVQHPVQQLSRCRAAAPNYFTLAE